MGQGLGSGINQGNQVNGKPAVMMRMMAPTVQISRKQRMMAPTAFGPPPMQQQRQQRQQQFYPYGY